MNINPEYLGNAAREALRATRVADTLRQIEKDGTAGYLEQNFSALQCLLEGGGSLPEIGKIVRSLSNTLGYGWKTVYFVRREAQGKSSQQSA